MADILPIRKEAVKRRPSFPPLKKLQNYNWGEWDTLPLVRAAMREHDIGIFQSSALIADAMLRDDRIRGAFHARANKLLGAPQTFKDEDGKKPTDQGKNGKPSLAPTAKGTSAKAKEVAETARLRLRKMLPRSEAFNLFRWGHFVGVGLGQLIWEMTEDSWQPRLKVWHPRYIRWDRETEAFKVMTTTGEVTVEVGTGQWLLYTPYGCEEGWMQALVRCLYGPWLARQWTRRDWSRHSEAHGIPMIKAWIPANAEEDDELNFMYELAERGSESTVRLPRNADGLGYDFDLVEATAQTWQAFQGLIAECNRDIAIAIKGENLTTEVKGGSLAAAGVHEDISDDVAEFDETTFCECINDQMFLPWARFNYAEADEVAPELGYEVKPAEDKKAAGDALKALGDGIAAIKALGVQADVDALMKDYDVPVTGPAKEPDPIVPDDSPFNKTQTPKPGVAAVPKKPAEKTLQASVAEDTTAAEAGQEYLNLITDEHLKAAVRAMSPERLKVLALVQKAQSAEELKEMLEEMFSALDPERLADIIQAALIEGELNGMYSAREG